MAQIKHVSMGTRWKRSHKDKGAWKTSRRRTALLALERQLRLKLKPAKEGQFMFMALTDKDVKRIEKEIEILKQRA